MREFAFELRLCARLEAAGKLVARQLGASVHRPGNRIVDVLIVEPGPSFDDRAAITSAEIPDLAIEANVGTGRARSRRVAFRDLDVHPDAARDAADRAVEIGFLARERRGGQGHLRQTARYPDDWFDRLVAIENKPDLGRPGDLEAQLRTDVALGLVDAVVLATESYVTRAHLNRFPDEVGVWRFDGDEFEVVREPTPLPVDGSGVEIVEEGAGSTEIRIVDGVAKARTRRRMAERAYGKGWRTYDLPACAHTEAAEIHGVGGLPRCGHYDRLVEPSTECGPACPAFEPAEAPAVDLATERDRTSSWTADPASYARRQSGLDRFG